MSPLQPEFGSEGDSPPKLERTAEGPPRSRPCERMKKTRSSSDGVRPLGPPRSSSVAGKGRRERKEAFPLALPLRYTSVLLYAVRICIHRCIHRLCSAILSRLSSALWSEKSEIGTPQVSGKALDAPDDAARFHIERGPATFSRR